MSEKVRDVDSALKKKGFKDALKRHHSYYFFWYKNKKTNIFTKISHNEKDISDNLCSQMAKQIKLSNQEFKSFVSCPLQQEGYVAILLHGKFLSE